MRMNHNSYKFYVTNTDLTQILSGWEYKEDALDAQKDTSEPTKIYMASYLNRNGLNPEENESWNKH